MFVIRRLQEWSRAGRGLTPIDWIDRLLHAGVLLYVLALFRATTLRGVLTVVLLAALAARLLLTRSEGLRFLREPVALLLGLFLALSIPSVIYSPDPAAAAIEYGGTWLTVAWLALTVPYALRDETALRRFLIASAVVAFYTNYVQFKGILVEHHDTGVWLQDVSYHRSHALSIMFFIPFLLALAVSERGWRSAIAWVLVGLQFLMLVMTAGRAGMLGTAAALLVWFVFRRDWRLFSAGAVVVLIVAAVYALLPDGNFLQHYLLNVGFSTSGRTENTWGPFVYLISQAPWFGYGYGAFVYPPVFAAAIQPAALTQSMNEVMYLGPHNYYLEIWFSAGIGALLAMIWLFARFSADLIIFIRRHLTTPVGIFALATFSTFTAHYLVHAHFGPLGATGLRPLGILLGLGIALQQIARRSGNQPA